MIYHGKIYDNSEQNRIISKLKEDLYHSIQYKSLLIETKSLKLR